MASFKEELSLAALDAGFFPVCKNFSHMETGIIGGVNPDGDMILVFGKKIDDQPSKILISNLGSDSRFLDKLKEDGYALNMAETILSKLNEMED